ncbi:glycosyltransferase [Candidatus Saccharibacteria bacterium]|nr:glycosyltransferase [Candidatus Saccharibacteria bacterium]
MAVDLSIVIPTLNEAKRIDSALRELSAYLRKQKQSVEVIIVDLHSPDGTAELAKKQAKAFESLKVIDAGPRPKGKFLKGKQVKLGVMAAKGRYIMFMDADLATPLKYIDNVFALMKEEKPIAICVRDLQSSHTGLRKFISGVGNFLVQLILLPGIKDTQCGFKVFEAEAARQIFKRQRVVSWGFDMEALAIARRLGYRIDTISVPDWHDVAGGSFGGKAIKSTLQTFFDLVRIKWWLITGRYNKARGHGAESAEIA